MAGLSASKMPSRAPSSTSSRPRSAAARGLGRRALLRSSTLALTLGCSLGLAGVTTAQANDQVFWINARGDVRIDSGTITENTLRETVLTMGDDEQSRASDLVVRVVFGNISPAFADGQAYMARGEFENAAAKFRLAAGDADTRPVGRAHARWMAANTLMERGKTDPAAFGEAQAEFETFLSEYPENRKVPQARMLLGRAQHLAGDVAAAGETYSALFAEGGSGTPTTGYPLVLCYEAGLAAAEAALAQGDGEAARALYGSIESSLPTILSGLEAGDPAVGELEAVQSAARLGEGFVLLASDQANQAVTFFRTQVQNAPADEPALRFGAQLGLGEALLASDEPREAQLALAQVSSLDFTSRDRVARALIGLAEAALALPDANARTQAKTWVDTVLEGYADTPAVLRAHELAARF